MNSFLKASLKVFVGPYLLVSYGLVAALCVNLARGGLFDQIAPMIALGLVALAIGLIAYRSKKRDYTLLFVLFATPPIFALFGPLLTVLLQF